MKIFTKSIKKRKFINKMRFNENQLKAKGNHVKKCKTVLFSDYYCLLCFSIHVFHFRIFYKAIGNNKIKSLPTPIRNYRNFIIHHRYLDQKNTTKNGYLLQIDLTQIKNNLHKFFSKFRKEHALNENKYGKIFYESN